MTSPLRAAVAPPLPGGVPGCDRRDEQTESMLAAWRTWLATPSGLTYLARRVRGGAKWADREQRGIDAWFASRPRRAA